LRVLFRRSASENSELARRDWPPVGLRVKDPVYFVYLEDAGIDEDMLALKQGRPEIRKDRKRRAGLLLDLFQWMAGRSAFAARPHEILDSTLLRTTSKIACLENRQNIVSVESNRPFSKYLFTGAPPPQ
jgi:hypothetical protein